MSTRNLSDEEREAIGSWCHEEMRADGLIVPQALTDEQIAEIQARRWVYSRGDERESIPVHERKISLTIAERDALCAAVRVLRVQVAQCEQAYELGSAVRLPEVGNLNVLQIVRKMAELHESNTALRGQLAVVQFDLRQANGWIEDVREREAAVCPEDVGFDEYIRTLQSQLAQVTAERDGLRQDDKKYRRQ